VAGLAVTTTLLGHLRSTRPWVRFLSVLGFIGMGFMLFAGLMLIVASGVRPSSTGSFPSALLAVVYLAFAAIYLWPVLALHRFGRALTRLLDEGSGEALEGAFRRQFLFWRAVGILTIVGLGLAVLAVPVAVVIGIAARK
jgi:hypothetical protein